MSESESVYTYLGQYAQELGERILQQFPPLHGIGDPISPRIRTLLRKPFGAQAAVVMGLVRSWQEGSRHTIVLGEMGTGKTLMSLGAVHVHSEKRPYTALAMVPPHLVNKWAREALQTVPGIRVFFVDGFRDASSNSPNGIHEVDLMGGRIVRKGLSTTLSELRLRRQYRTARERWLDRVRKSLFIVGRETAKLGPAWRHVYRIAESGSNRGRLVNCDSGEPLVNTDGERLTAEDFGNYKRSQKLCLCGEKPAKLRHSALWQVDRDKIRRIAPIEFIGRYLDDFFDYAICDELHQLAHITAQGNALGVLAACCKHLLGLTGTLVDGYAGHLFNILFRFVPRQMREAGYEFSASGRGAFINEYGVLEQIEVTSPCDNQVSDARTTMRSKERPGASPRLFGDFLLPHCGFIFLKDITAHLPRYTESVIPIAMDRELLAGYEDLEDRATELLKEHTGNASVMSTLMHALLLYPNHPFGFGPLCATRWDKDQKRKVRFRMLEPVDLPRNVQYPKESALIEDIRQELAAGRRCHVFAVYTKAQHRLQEILSKAGFRVAHLTVKVPPRQRESWYAKQVLAGIQVVVAHPKLVETGLDLLDFPTFYFYETGHSLHVMRQSSRRSYRIGQRLPVRVKFMIYEKTTQDLCLQLMLKKKLVALTTEGQISGEDLEQGDDDETDILAAVARGLMKQDIGETAEQAWRTLRETEEALETAGLAPGGLEADSDPFAAIDTLEAEEETHSWPVADIVSTAPITLLQSPDTYLRTRRRSRSENPDQGSLF